MMEQMINPEYVSFNKHQVPKRTNQNFGSYREQPSLQKKQPVVPTLNLPQNDLYS